MSESTSEKLEAKTSEKLEAKFNDRKHGAFFRKLVSPPNQPAAELPAEGETQFTLRQQSVVSPVRM